MEKETQTDEQTDEEQPDKVDDSLDEKTKTMIRAMVIGVMICFIAWICVKSFNIYGGDSSDKGISIDPRNHPYRLDQSELCSVCKSNLDDKDFIIPSIKSIGLWIRREPILEVLPITKQDLTKGSINGRTFQNIFDILGSYLYISKRPCLSMHHLKGYKGNPKNLMGIMTNKGKFLIKALNVTITGSSKEMKTFKFHPTQCEKEVLTLRKHYKIRIEYIEHSETTSEDSLGEEGDSRNTEWITGLPALCVQANLEEMEGKNLCNQKLI